MAMVEKKRDMISRGKKIIKKKEFRIRRRRARVSTVQKLFVACKGMFKGPGTVPLSADVQMLRHILDRMKPEDVGLSSDLSPFNSGAVGKGTPRVTYASTIYQCKNFSMCIFFLPPSAVLPLHNHPGMTVFSKLLVGSMHIKAYDWVDPIKSQDPILPSQLRLAKLKADAVFTAPCDTSVLYPAAGGNIHEFTAVTPCAVLDVMGPPYSKEDGRDCTYYRDFPYSVLSDGTVEEKNTEERGCYRWLEEIDMPKDLKLVGVPYQGPQINDSL